MSPEYILKPDGRVIRRPAEIIVPGEYEIQVNPQTIAAIMPKSRVRLSNFIPGPTGPISVSATDTEVIFSTRISVLKMECTVEVDAKGNVFPTWQDAGTFVQLHWPIPPTMFLTYCARALPVSGYNVWCVHEVETYLFALDKARRSFRLPLPNIYEDGHICTGVGAEQAPGPLEVFLKCFNRFLSSRWNSHLTGSDVRNKAATLFAFKAVEKGFEAVPAVAKWEPYCFPAVHSILENVTL